MADYDAGIAAVLERRSDVLFGDREKLLQAVRRNPDERDLRVLTRRFTFALLALATPRNDDDFRLAVDRALSEVYADPAFGALYTDTLRRTGYGYGRFLQERRRTGRRADPRAPVNDRVHHVGMVTVIAARDAHAHFR